LSIGQDRGLDVGSLLYPAGPALVAAILLRPPDLFIQRDGSDLCGAYEQSRDVLRPNRLFSASDDRWSRRQFSGWASTIQRNPNEQHHIYCWSRGHRTYRPRIFWPPIVPAGRQAKSEGPDARGRTASNNHEHYEVRDSANGHCLSAGRPTTLQPTCCLATPSDGGDSSTNLGEVAVPVACSYAAVLYRLYSQDRRPEIIGAAVLGSVFASEC
jgi:hypothetical protein